MECGWGDEEDRLIADRAGGREPPTIVQGTRAKEGEGRMRGSRLDRMRPAGKKPGDRDPSLARIRVGRGKNTTHGGGGKIDGVRLPERGYEEYSGPRSPGGKKGHAPHPCLAFEQERGKEEQHPPRPALSGGCG